MAALFLGGCDDAAKRKAEADKAAALETENAALKKERADLHAKVAELDDACRRTASPVSLDDLLFEKPSTSLVEDAQLVAAEKGRWISERPFVLTTFDNQEQKVYLTLGFVMEQGQLSGKLWLGTMEFASSPAGKTPAQGRGGAAMSYIFELTGNDRNRTIKLFGVSPQKTKFDLLPYSIHGNHLTIRFRLQQWPIPELAVPIRFKRGNL